MLISIALSLVPALPARPPWRLFTHPPVMALRGLFEFSRRVTAGQFFFFSFVAPFPSFPSTSQAKESALGLDQLVPSSQPLDGLWATHPFFF